MRYGATTVGWVAVALLVVRGVSVGASAPEGSADALETLSAELGSGPAYCAELSAGHMICTWQRGGEHIVCEVGGGEVLSECLHVRDNESMQTFHARKGGKGALRLVRDRQPQIEAARAEVDEAVLLGDMVRLVGAGPRWCHEKGVLRCSWFLVRRTPGYNLLGRYANAPGKKLNMICEFPGAAEPKGPEACSVVVSGTPHMAPPRVAAARSQVPEPLRSCELASDRLCRVRGLEARELETCVAEHVFECVSSRRGP